MRDKWGGRSAFILAAIGSAVGLGNAWRFPGLCAEYGGGAFLIAYMICMLLLGIPLLMMEFAIGRKTQKSAPQALGSLNKKAKWIGWAATGNAFFIMTFYAAVFAWCILMLVSSYKFATVASTTEAASTLWQNTIGTSFSTSFGGQYVNLGMVFCFITAWILIYSCVRNGAKQVGKIVKYTVTLPVAMLFILAIKGFVDNPHLGEALSALFIPDWNSFFNVELWIAAAGQAFFSLSIMAAIMIVYGSFLRKDSNIFTDGLIIAFSDLAISVLSGLVLFTTMYSTGLTIEDMSASGVATAFIIYPTAIVNLTSSGVFNAIFGFMFYFMLCTLAIDSAFSTLEGVSSAVSDYFRVEKKKIMGKVALLSAAIGLIFVTGAGVAFVDIIDNWVNQYSMIIVGILEAILVGWFFKPKKIPEEINKNTEKYRMPGWWFNFSVRYFSPIVLLFLIVWQFIILIKNGFRYDTNYSLAAEIILGWFVLFLILTSGFVINAIMKRTKRGREILALDEKEPMWDEIKS